MVCVCLSVCPVRFLSSSEKDSVSEFVCVGKCVVFNLESCSAPFLSIFYPSFSSSSFVRPLFLSACSVDCVLLPAACLNVCEFGLFLTCLNSLSPARIGSRRDRPPLMTNSRSTKRTYCTDCCCCCFSSNANHRTTKKRRKLEDQRWSWWWCLIKKCSVFQEISTSVSSPPLVLTCGVSVFRTFLPIFSSFLGISYRESNDVFAALYFRRQPLPPLDVRWIQLSASIAPFTARSLSLNKKSTEHHLYFLVILVTFCSLVFTILKNWAPFEKAASAALICKSINWIYLVAWLADSGENL